MTIDTEQLKRDVDLKALATNFTALKRKTALELAGPCPRCGGTDRFYVQAGFFACRSCHPQRGDAIEFAVWLNGLDFQSACEWLGAPTTPRAIAQPPPAQQPTQPGANWQDTARRIIADCERNLWGDIGAKARAWLAARGLWEETLLGWRVGYCPKDGVYNCLFVSRGIVLPWFNADGTIWKLNVRRPVGRPTYKEVKGSRNSGLFGSQRLTGKPDCIITEGEFDALLVWQELGDLADVLTLGGATGTVDNIWLPILLPYKRFWIATDNDEAGAGAAEKWLNLVGERGERILPPGDAKDITEAWQAGLDLREWFAKGGDKNV